MSSAPQSRLFLLRHAHSSWALPGQRDHQRMLDARGRDDAPKIGAEIAARGYLVDHVVCSTATRAVETLTAIRSSIGAASLEESDDLYALGVDAYFAAARAGGHASVMLVGHNPMIEEFALQLAGTSEQSASETLREGFPTAGLAVIDFDGPLSAITAASGRLVRLIHPGTL